MLLLLLILLIMFMISMILLLLNFLISKKKNNDREKITSFECGFDPFSLSRIPFSIQFYLVSMIFLIFDIEIIVFFPFVFSLPISSINTIITPLFLFIFILLLGLYIEWKDGALTWIK